MFYVFQLINDDIKNEFDDLWRRWETATSTEASIKQFSIQNSFIITFIGNINPRLNWAVNHR